MTTARYGSGAVYGTPGLTYGPVSATGLLLWSVEVDWDQDGFFTGSNEAGRMISITRNRGRKTMLKRTGQGFETIPPGKCVIKLKNNDGRYDGWNTSSPLYPYVTYGADVRIRWADQSDMVLHDYFYGTIQDIKPFGYGADAYVEIHIEDTGRYLRDYTARYPIVEGAAPDVAIGHILDAVSWPARWGRNLDFSYDSMSYWWASGNKLGWSEIEDIAQSFLGLFFIAANGNARFIDRNTAVTPSLSLDQTQLLKDINNPQPFVNRRNITRLKVHPREEAASGVIYQLLGDTPLVETGSGNAKEIWANYTYSNVSVPAKTVLQPVATTDFTMNTNADGSGTDKTADCTVVVYDFGDNALVVITNLSGGNVYVTKLQIKGIAIYEQYVSDVTYPTSISSVVQPREFILDQKWQQSVNTAVDYSRLLGPFLDDSHPFPTVKIQGRPDIQVGLELFDAVPLNMGKLGIFGESFRIGGISERSLTDTCQDVETTLYLEPYITNEEAWRWPILDFGTDTIFGAG
jgi:hypothetical protein